MTSVLYDAPGPRARRRSRLTSVVSLVAIAALLAWIIYIIASPRSLPNGQQISGLLDPSRLDILSNPLVWLNVWHGLVSTLQLAAVGAILALTVGVLVSFARVSQHRWLRVTTGVVLEFFRGMPVLLMMLFVLLVFSTGAYWAGAIALAVYNGALIAEILRAGLQSLPKGQREAGLAIGLTSVKTRLFIEYPQAFRQMLPILIAQLVVLLKDTSLAYVVGYSELLRTVQNMQNFLGNRYLFTLFAIALVIYLGVNLLLSWLARVAARRTDHARVGRDTGMGEADPVVLQPGSGSAI